MKVTDSRIKGAAHFALSGFTLVELLVSLMIFALISISVVVNYRAASRASDLRITARQIASVIISQHARAQNGHRIELCADDGRYANYVCSAGSVACLLCEFRMPDGGYGVHISDGNIILFADTDGDHGYDPGEALAQTDNSVNLPDGIVVDLTMPDMPLDLTFQPPRPDVWINNCSRRQENCPLAASIVLRNTISGQSSTVTVQMLSGRVTVE